MNVIDQDTLILEELKSQDIEGLTVRGKLAIRELADMDEGAIIFLILSLNSRIRTLENALHYQQKDVSVH